MKKYHLMTLHMYSFIYGQAEVLNFARDMVEPGKCPHMVIFSTCIPDLPGWNLVRDIDYPD
jgi:hypothetical protein